MKVFVFFLALLVTTSAFPQGLPVAQDSLVTAPADSVIYNGLGKKQKKKGRVEYYDDFPTVRKKAFQQFMPIFLTLTLVMYGFRLK